MADYRAPLDDLTFALATPGGLSGLRALPAFAEADPQLIEQIVAEAGRLAAEVWAPLNHSGDRAGCRLENGVVRTPEGFAEAYRAYVDSGFNALPFDPAYGGQGLPWTLALALTEVWNAANMSLALAPLLTVGAVELLQAHGTDDQKTAYLPKLIAGQWTGTMDMSEPQAGSDLGQIATRAERAGDGSYRITGQKVYITWGEHDLAENILHMVLARLPDAPAGTHGLSLFLVPKVLPDAEGEPGRRNDLRCTGLEDKLGIHGSATCQLAFGDTDGAVGYLIGAEHRGLPAMFTMMNTARLGVGAQAVGVAERAYQDARAYAFERVQSKDIRGSEAPVPIVRHPNVRRKLLTMRALVEGGRALVLFAGNAMDRAKQADDPEMRRRLQTRTDLLVPVVKAWCSERACEVTSTAIQVFAGMGFVEETGVAQYYRDARIAPIYEGTNGIQALDLTGRKVLRDAGAGVHALIDDLRALTGDPAAAADAELAAIRGAVRPELDRLERASDRLLELGERDIAAAAAVADPYLELLGTVAAGALLAQQAAAASADDGADGGRAAPPRGKRAVARFYCANVLPRAQSAAAQVEGGAEATLAPSEALL